MNQPQLKKTLFFSWRLAMVRSTQGFLCKRNGSGSQAPVKRWAWLHGWRCHLPCTANILVLIIIISLSKQMLYIHINAHGSKIFSPGAQNIHFNSDWLHLNSLNNNETLKPLGHKSTGPFAFFYKRGYDWRLGC